jgi:hypothetical protein
MRPALNTKGFLIRAFDEILFRQYFADGSFRDYDILHHDLEVTITDDGAIFDDQNETLDYAL